MGPVHLRGAQSQGRDRAYRQRLRHQHRTVVAGLSVHRARRESRRGFAVRAVIRNVLLVRARGDTPSDRAAELEWAANGMGSLMSDQHGLAVVAHEGAPLAPRTSRRELRALQIVVSATRVMR